jgi:hypothetical protein
MARFPAGPRFLRAVPLLSLTLVLLRPGAPVQGFAGVEGWAWVVARQPTSASYVPRPRDQGTSVAAGTNAIARLATGTYLVRFGGFQTPAPVIHATAISGGPDLCSVGDRGLDGSDYLVQVTCFDRLGNARDLAFSLDVAAYTTLADDMGYVIDEQPGQAMSTPAVQYSSAQATNTVKRLGTGRWEVTLPALGGGTARGGVIATDTDAGAASCRVTGWTAGIVATVACRTAAGALADRPFSLTYLRDRGLKEPGAAIVAYLRSDHPSAASSVPARGFWFSSAGRRPAIARASVGRYVVTLPGVGPGGSAQVTAFGAGTRRCGLGAIRHAGTPQRLVVRCWTADGSAPADARFTLSYTR